MKKLFDIVSESTPSLENLKDVQEVSWSEVQHAHEAFDSEREEIADFRETVSVSLEALDECQARVEKMVKKGTLSKQALNAEAALVGHIMTASLNADPARTNVTLEAIKDVEDEASLEALKDKMAAIKQGAAKALAWVLDKMATVAKKTGVAWVYGKLKGYMASAMNKIMDTVVGEKIEVKATCKDLGELKKRAAVIAKRNKSTVKALKAFKKFVSKLDPKISKEDLKAAVDAFGKKHAVTPDMMNNWFETKDGKVVIGAEEGVATTRVEPKEKIANIANDVKGVEAVGEGFTAAIEAFKAWTDKLEDGTATEIRSTVDGMIAQLNSIETDTKKLLTSVSKDLAAFTKAYAAAEKAKSKAGSKDKKADAKADEAK